MLKTLADMYVEVRKLNTDKGFRDQGLRFGEYVALLHSEASEMLEAFRDYGFCYHETDGKPDDIGSEAADVLIRLLDMADVYGIDLAEEYERKMAYNWTRPYRHGGRTLRPEVAPAVRAAPPAEQ